jgi:hypothetical protein
MKRIGLALLLSALVGGGGMAAPARAEPSIDELRQCVEANLRYFAADPTDRYYVFTTGVYMCSVHYAYRATSPYRLSRFRTCMYKAFGSYQPITGIEPPVYYAYLCTEEYLGLDLFGSAG